MTGNLAEPPGWTPRRWWSIVGLVFIGQLTLIFWLSERDGIHSRTAAAGPQLHLVEDDSSQLLALTDPTLFALPHPRGFSGLAWLKTPIQDFHPFAWSEPQQWLQMPTGLLGAAFERFLTTNVPNPLQTLSQPEPGLILPHLPHANDFPEYSTFRITGELSKRRLLDSIELPSWPNPEILTNSQVQLVVDAQGIPVSVTLMYPGSGLKDADTNAIWQATRARFAPLNPDTSEAANPLSGLSWGQMVFEWHTLPVPLTNTTQGFK